MTSLIPSLSAAFVRQHLAYPKLVDAVADVLSRLTQMKDVKEKFPRIQQPLRTALTTTDGSGMLLNMPSYVADQGVFAVKLVTLFPGNTTLPTHQGVVLLFDSTNGQPLAMMGAEEVTARRTAATSALASLHLAPRDASCLAVLGAGTQAETHIEAHLSVMSSVRRIHVWNRTRQRAESLVEKLRRQSVDPGIIFQVYDTVKDAVAEADIVCTVTSAVTPILDADWLTRPGVHVNAVGAPRPDRRELETNVLTRSYVVADSRQSALKESGDVIAAGVSVDAELGQIVTDGLKVDRNTVPTVFKSLGVALEDLVGAKIAYDAHISSV